MPEISRFLGIIILMNYEDHNPPHFHAKYGEYEVLVEIESGIATGNFPKRALKSVLEWHRIYKNELLQDWVLASERKALKKIKPLE